MKNNIKKTVSLIVLKKLINDINLVIDELKTDGGGYEFLDEEQQSIVDFGIEYLDLEHDTVEALQDLQDEILDDEI